MSSLCLRGFFSPGTLSSSHSPETCRFSIRLIGDFKLTVSVSGGDPVSIAALKRIKQIR